jgi:Protein of unknown function (DUF4239)
MNLVAQAGILIGVAVVVLGLLWAARQSPLNETFARELRDEHDRAFEFLGTAFAVLIAFVVLEAYDSYNDAKSGAETEAEAVLQLSRTVDAFEPHQQTRLEGVLICYGRAVIHFGWPAMDEKEEGSPVVNDWGTRFREEALRVDINSPIQQASFRQLLIEQDRRIEGRRARLAEAVRVVPPPLWFVLFLGAVLTIGWVILSAGRRGSLLVQATVVTSIAALVTSALLLVWFLDHPFADEPGSITPIEMEHALETIEHEAEDQGIEVTPRCTPTGEPEQVKV